MTAWLRLHGMAFGATLAKLARTPFATLLNVLVIGIALALPAGAYALLVDMQAAARGVSGDPELSVFMALDAKKEEVAAIEKRLRAEAKIEYLNKSDAPAPGKPAETSPVAAEATAKPAEAPALGGEAAPSHDVNARGVAGLKYTIERKNP